MDKDHELSKLKKSILKLKKNFRGKNLVFSDGNKDSKVMIIGEAPGRTEDKLQKPFVGRAGKLLDSLLETVNLDRTTVYITNVVNYRPDKNRKPTSKEINQFKKLLFKHIKIISPKSILLLGATAAAAVLNYIGPLSEVRGKWKSKKIPLLKVKFYQALSLSKINSDLKKVSVALKSETVKKVGNQYV